MTTFLWSQPAKSTHDDIFELQGRRLHSMSGQDRTEITRQIARASSLARGAREQFGDGSWAVSERVRPGRTAVLAEVRTRPIDSRHESPDGITVLVDVGVTRSRRASAATEALTRLREFARDTGQVVDDDVLLQLEKYMLRRSPLLRNGKRGNNHG